MTAMTSELDQKHWKVKAALYFFFEGGGAGCYFIAVLVYLVTGWLSTFAGYGLAVGIVSVIIGAAFLWFDLGKKWRFFWAVKNPTMSWIARGIILVAIFLLLAASYTICSVWPLAWLDRMYSLKVAWGGVSALLALAILTYPSMLLRSCKPFKLWDNPMVVVLSVILSLLTGMAMLTLVLFGTILQTGITPYLSSLIRFGLAACNGLLLAEIITVVIYSLCAYGFGNSGRASILRLLGGDLRAYFVATVVVGWISPLVFISVGLFANGGAVTVWISLPSAILVLAGALLMRYLLLAAATREAPFLQDLM